MNILWVTMDVPYPPRRGQRMRNWAILRAMAEEGHSITLISLIHSTADFSSRGVLEQCCRKVQFICLPESRVPKLLHRMCGAFSDLPYAAWRMKCSALRDAAYREACNASYDVILWDEVYNLVNLPLDLPAPVVLNTQDVIRVIWQRYRSIEKNPLKRAYSDFECRKLCAWEERSSWPIAGIIACSENDAATYRNMYPRVPTVVANNSVDLANYQRPITDDGRTVLFVGGLDWFPNLDAVRYFCQQMIPRLRSLHTELRFVVAGKIPNQAVERELSAVPEMHLTGEIEDMASAVAAASVCVVPLRIGSGTRMKILEAAALRKPVVSTSVGAEGLHFVPEEEIAIADHPAEFALQITGFLQDSAKRMRIGNAAFQRVRTEYSIGALRNALRSAFEPFSQSHATVAKS